MIAVEHPHCRSDETFWPFVLPSNLRKCEQFQSHFTCANDLETYSCEKCNFETFLKVDHSNHVKSEDHSGNFELEEREEFNCGRCNVNTFSKYLIEAHKSNINCWSTISDDGIIKCKVCDRIVATRNGLKQHVQRKHSGFVNLKKLFQCSYCPYNAKYKLYVQSHILRRHMNPDEIEWFKCDQCHYQAKTKGELKIHISERHAKNNKKFTCDQCSYGASNKHRVSRHIYYVHNNSATLHKCNHCAFTTKYKKRIERHRLVFHSDESNWVSCDQCTYRGKNNFCLKRHIKYKHEKSLHLLKCDYCPYTSRYISSMKRHITIKHEDSVITYQFSSNLCPEEFNKEQYLAHHKKEAHIPTEGKKLFKCDQCTFETNYKDSLNQHTLRHHAPSKKFQCDQCPYKASVIYDLRKHWKYQHSDMWYKCENCDYSTRNKPALVLHYKNKHVKGQSNKQDVISHMSPIVQPKGKLKSNPDDPISCSLCLQKFKASRYLASHMRNVHRPVGEIKWFECTQCNFKTKYKSKLPDHVKRHTNLEKKFNCDKCSYKTAHKDNLNKHWQSKHSDKWYECEHCDYKTRNRDTFRAHYVNRHANPESVTWHQCLYCDVKSKSKASIKRHMQVVHTEQCL